MKIFFLTSFIEIKWQNSKKEKEEHAVLFLWGFSRLIGYYSVSDIIFCFHIDLLTYQFILQYLIDLIDFNYLIWPLNSETLY